MSLINEETAESLKPKQTLDEVIHHEVKEIGTHMCVEIHLFLILLNIEVFYIIGVIFILQIGLRSYVFE